jgi:hypothetical protein
MSLSVSKLDNRDPRQDAGQLRPRFPVGPQMAEVPDQANLVGWELFAKLERRFETVQHSPTGGRHGLQCEADAIVSRHGEQQPKSFLEQAAGMPADMSIQRAGMNHQAACPQGGGLCDGLYRVVDLQRKGTSLRTGKSSTPAEAADRKFHFVK